MGRLAQAYRSQVRQAREDEVKKEYSKANIIVGSVYEVETFALATIHIRVTGFDKQGLGFLGDIARKSDLDALKIAGVPWDSNVDWPDNCETFVWFDQVIKKVRKKRSKKKKGVAQ